MKKNITTSEEAEKRLGWFQISLLTILWKRSMYGLEIQNYLKLQGSDVSVGQIYPALKRLEEENLISSYEEVRKGANRKFYTLTQNGRNSILKFVEMFKSVFNGVIWQKLSFVPDKILEFYPINNGNVILYISLIYPEEFLKILMPKVGLTGHYFLLSESETQSEQINLLIDYLNIQVSNN